MYEPNMQDVFDLFQQKFGVLSSAQKEKLCIAHDEGMSPFVLGCAILRAKQAERYRRERGEKVSLRFNYVYEIIRDWLNHGITTEEKFLVYWEALNEDKRPRTNRQKGVSKHSAQIAEKVAKEDFTYTEPNQDRSIFQFLDD